MAATLVLVADALAVANAAAQTLATTLPIIQKAQAEGRTTLTADEWAQIKGDADAADTQFANDLAKGA
jgi:hypothetical protein